MRVRVDRADGGSDNALPQRPADPGALLASIRDAVHAHQGGPIGTDDQTLIVLRID